MQATLVMVTHGKYAEDDKWWCGNVFQQCGWSSSILGAFLCTSGAGNRWTWGGESHLGGGCEFPKGRWKVIRLNTLLVVAKIQCICTLADFLVRYWGSSLSKHCTFKEDIYKMVKSWCGDLDYLSKATCLLQGRWFDQPYHRTSITCTFNDYAIWWFKKNGPSFFFRILL